MKNFFKQTGEILAINIKMKYKTLLLFGMLMYLGLFIIAAVFPELINTVFGFIKMDSNGMENDRESTVMKVTFIAGMLNFIFGTFLIMKNFIVSKREFLSMPYDLSPKILALYIYMFIWFILNTVTVLLTMFYMLYRKGALHISFPSGEVIQLIAMLVIALVLFGICYCSYYFILLFVWREKSVLFNMVIFILSIIGFAFIEPLIKYIIKILAFTGDRELLPFKIFYVYGLTYELFFIIALYLIFTKMNIKE